MLTSVLYVYATFAAIFGLAVGAMAVVRPAWARPAINTLESGSGCLGQAPVGTLAQVHSAGAASVMSSVLDQTVFDLERSRWLAPAVAVIVGLLIPFAAATNAVLGGSPRLLIAYAAAALLIAFLSIADTLVGPRRWTQWIAGSIVFLWAVLLPLYATWSLTSHFREGPLDRCVAAGLVLGCFLYAILATIWTMIRRDRGPTVARSMIDIVAPATIGLPLFYIGYWLMLALAAATGTNVQARGWHDLSATVLAGGLAFGAVYAILRTVGTRRTSPSAIAALIGSGLVAALASWIISIAGGREPLVAWLAMLPMILWGLLPLSLAIVILSKSIQMALPTKAWSSAHPLEAMAVGGLLLAGCLLAAAGVAV